VLRASVAAERAGVPSVSLITPGFERQALATGRGLGFDAMRVAVLDAHPDALSHDELVAGFLANTVPQVIAGLTAALDDNRSIAADEPQALDVVATGTIDDIVDLFNDRGWSDGLPIVPPTRERVEAFLAVTGHDPWRVIGVAKPSGREVTVWSVAVNGVMAGCRPEHLPVLLAAAEILTGAQYGAEHSGNTTGADALMVLDGPCVIELGYHFGPGAHREGHRANTATGRWLRLFLRKAGCDLLASFGTLAAENTYPRLVVWENRPVHVALLAGEGGAVPPLPPELRNALRTEPELLVLHPTARSHLR